MFTHSIRKTSRLHAWLISRGVFLLVFVTVLTTLVILPGLQAHATVKRPLVRTIVSSNVYEDNCTRGVTTSGWGKSTNNEGLANFSWKITTSNLPYMTINANTCLAAYNSTAGSLTGLAGKTARPGGDVLALITFSAVGSVNAGILLDGNGARTTWYDLRIDTGAQQLDLEKKVSSKQTIEASAPISVVAGTPYWLRSDFNQTTGVWSGKIWPANQAEPTQWLLTWQDPLPLTAGILGMHFHWLVASPDQTVQVSCFAYAPSGSIANSCA